MSSPIMPAPSHSWDVCDSDAGDHFRISDRDSFSVLNGDIEGGGVAYAFGSGVHNFYSIGNCLSGFAGTYYRGSLPDQGYVLSDSYQDTYLRNVHSGYERAKEIRVLNDAAGVGTYLRIDTSASGVPGCLSWSSLGDDRWSMYKAADNSLNVKDATTGRIGLTLAQGSDVWDFKGDRFANVKSFSATGTPANNLRGTFVVSEANSRETMTFKTAEPMPITIFLLHLLVIPAIQRVVPIESNQLIKPRKTSP